MKLSQLIESFVISNDEFEDYLNRATEQLTQELQSGKNPRDAVHDLALTFADQHNKSYDAYTRMSDSLSARMHTLELDGSTSTEIAPADMTNGPDMSDMGLTWVIWALLKWDAEPEMMTDPMGDMEMDVPAEDDMPGDSDMEDYSAVMDNKPEVEESYSQGDENEEGMVSNCCGAPIMDVYQGHGRCSDCKEMASAEKVEESVDPDMLSDLFDNLKRGDKIKIKHDSALEKGTDYIEYIVKANNVLRNGVGKVTLARADSPTSVKRFLYKRNGKVSMAIGDMATTLVDIQMSESVNEGTKGCADCEWIKDETDGDIDTCDECAAEKRMTNEASDADEKARQRAFAKADEPERGEKPKKVSLKKAPWEESVNEAKASILDQLKGIVDDKQAKSIKFDDGSSKVDMFTASAITQVHAKVNDDNKAKIEKMLNTRPGLMKIAKIAMGALKEGKLDEVLPAVGAVAGGIARAAMSKGIKGAVTRAGIKGVAKSAFSNEAEEMAGKIVRTSSRQSFSEYNEFYKALDSAAKAGKKAGDTIEVGGKQVKLKSNPKEIHNLSDAEMDKIDALALRLNEKSCSSKYKK